MTRPALFAAAGAAVLALAACDQADSKLKSAEVGDCFQRTGTDSLGKPIIEPVACATETAAAEGAAPAEGAEAEVAETASAGQPPAAPPAAGSGATVLSALTTGKAADGTTCVKLPVCAPAGGGYVATSNVRPKVSAGKSASKRRAAVTRRSTTTHRSSGGGTYDYVGLGIDYAHADTDTYRSNDYASRQSDYRQTYSNTTTDYARSQSTYSQQNSAAYYGSASAYGSGYGYAQGGGYGYAQPNPCCVQPRAPGPHSPFDSQGFLTWPGKTPGY